MSSALKNIFSRFETGRHFVRARELGSGHINDTFLIETDRKPFYVLQKINRFVFKDPEKLIGNKFAVSRFLQNRLSHLPPEEMRKRVLIPVPAGNGKNFCNDEAGDFWNLMLYIDDSVCFEKAPNKRIAFAAGKIYGDFLSLTKDLDPAGLFEILPGFHSIILRLGQFDEALKTASKERIAAAKDPIAFAGQRRNEMQKIERLVRENKIPLRVTHNDTKISNVLFSKDEKALCVIDTDTVMPGVIHYDFGDAVRTICTTAAEDERDLSKVGFDLEFFGAFVRGFFSTPLKGELSRTETANLAFSARVMTFIMGLRMLTDFLNGDVYYKTNYETHNLDRARNQFKLVSEMEKAAKMMDEIVQTELNSP